MSLWNRIAQIYSSLGGSSSGKGGPVGSLGDISFEVSSYKQIYTIDDYKRDVKARYATHQVIGSKPLAEFLGPDLMSISFEIKLHVAWGVNPTEEMNKLIEYCESGEVLSFVLGNKPVGKDKWVIESVGEAVDIFDTDGSILYSKASVSLMEYVENGADSIANN